jgi:uncharacterized membrane protein YgcG
VIFASCLDPEPVPAGTPPLADRLAAIADAAPMAVCGGNGMGFFNLEHSVRVCGYPEPADLAAGPVAVVSHSGSVFSALLHNHRDLRFNLVVSAGNELVTTTAAYLDHALELPSTRGADEIFATCIRALLDDPATAALALNLDLTTEPTPATSYTGLAIDAAAATAKPVAVVAAPGAGSLKATRARSRAGALAGTARRPRAAAGRGRGTGHAGRRGGAGGGGRGGGQPERRRWRRRDGSGGRWP